eukprot:7391234-Prymnesium_polylepis.1
MRLHDEPPHLRISRSGHELLKPLAFAVAFTLRVLLLVWASIPLAEHSLIFRKRLKLLTRQAVDPPSVVELDGPTACALVPHVLNDMKALAITAPRHDIRRRPLARVELDDVRPPYCSSGSLHAQTS